MKGLTVILALLLLVFAQGLAMYLRAKGALPSQQATRAMSPASSSMLFTR